jgi:NitT/TauT family transport system substrate-binding protein
MADRRQDFVIQETSRNVLYAPYYIALDILKQESGAPQVGLVTSATTTTTIDAMLTGGADFTFGGLSRAEKEFDIDPKRDMVSFGEGVARDPSYIAGRQKQPGFKITDLAGRRVGSFARQRPSHLFLRHDLAQAGIGENDLTWVPCPDDVTAARMLAADELDYAQANRAIPPGDLGWNIVQNRAERGPTSYGVMFGYRARVHALRPLLARYIKALAEAERAVADATADGVADLLAGYFPDRAAILPGCHMYKEAGTWSRSPDVPLAGYDGVIDAVMADGYLAKRRPYEVAVDNAFGV